MPTVKSMTRQDVMLFALSVGLAASGVFCSKVIAAGSMEVIGRLPP